MVDELSVKRMKRCAQTGEGHTFTEETHGRCIKCDLVVIPSDEDKELVMAEQAKVRYTGAPDECDVCWPHKIHDEKGCADCKENDFGCGY